MNSELLPPTRTARFFRTLAGHTIVFGLSTLVRPLSQLVLVRLHTNPHFVSVEGFAVWTLLQVALNIGIVLFNLGLATAFFRFYLLAEDEREKLLIVSRCFRLTVLIAVIGAGLMYLFAEQWVLLLVGREGYAETGRHLAFAVAGNTLTIIPLAYLRAVGRWKPFLVFNLLKFFALIGFNALFLIGMRMEVRGITLAMAVSNMLFAVIFIPYVLGKLRSEPFFQGFGTITRFGIPLVATDVTFWILSNQGQVLLNNWRQASEVALFGFALRIAFIVQVAVVMPFSVAFAPLLFQAQKDEADPRYLFARTMDYIWTISLGFCLAVTLFAREIALVLGKNPFYHQALPLVDWMIFASAFYAVFFVFSSGPNLKDKTWLFPIVLLVAGLVEFGLNVILIPHYGVMAAAQSMFIGYLVLAVLTYFAGQRVYPINFPWKRVTLAGAAALVPLLALHLILEPNLLLRFLLLLVFPLVLLVGGYLDKGERRTLKRFFTKKESPG